jgi:hypothetical protein
MVYSRLLFQRDLYFNFDRALRGAIAHCRKQAPSCCAAVAAAGSLSKIAIDRALSRVGENAR